MIIISDQVDWKRQPELLQIMHGIHGASYTAVLRWIVVALIEMQDSLVQEDVIELLNWSRRVCKWRQRMIATNERPNKGHKNALEMWKEIRDVLEYFKIREIRGN